jgi:hypothetical protein
MISVSPAEQLNDKSLKFKRILFKNSCFLTFHKVQRERYTKEWEKTDAIIDQMPMRYHWH